MANGCRDLCLCVGIFFACKVFLILVFVKEARPFLASVFICWLLVLTVGILACVLFVAIVLGTAACIKLYDISSPSRKQMFLVSCISVLTDPLFLYIPIVDENNKCLGTDGKLRTAALVLRALTDAPSLLHIIHQIDTVIGLFKLKSSKKPEGTKLVEFHKWQHEMRLEIRTICVQIAVNFLAVLPIPHVMILVIFLSKRDSIIYTRTPVIAFLVSQYLVRAYQIYQRCLVYKRVWRRLRAAFNFCLYILAAHVLGAFWYFSSIGRETSCWQQAYNHMPGYRHAYYCNYASASTNITFLDELCPIDPSNTKLFDFGIFLQLLQSGNTGSVGFFRKYFYSFWWGVKNMSNFGTNLEPSSYVWESIFAIIICLIGLILFIYLIGNVQTYIQMETGKSLSEEDETIKRKYEDIETWMSESGVPEIMSKEIMKHVKDKNVLEKDIDVDVDLNFLFSVTPKEFKNSFIEHFCLNVQQSVPKLEKMSEVGLRTMCAYMRPQIYPMNSYIFRKGKTGDKMIIIVKGTVVCSKKSNSSEEAGTSSTEVSETRTTGAYCGEELLDRKPENSSQDVQCQTKVEAFVIRRQSTMKEFIDYWRQREWDQNSTRESTTKSEIRIERILRQRNNQSATAEKNEV